MRALPVTKAPEATKPPVADLDCSNANVLAVAKDLFKIWTVVVGKRTRPCPWLAALGAKLMSMHGDKKKKRGKVIQYQEPGRYGDGGQGGQDAILAYGLNPFAAVRKVTTRRPCTQATGPNFMLLTALHRELQRLAAAF